MSQPQESSPREPDLGRFRLGEWSVHRAEGTLHWNGKSARLEPRVMDVLVYLASEPGRVISKEELLGAVWGGVYVEEGALSQAVHSLRKALGDSARHPRYVQTIPKRGYRLLAPVVSDQAQIAERSIDNVPTPLREPASWAPLPVSLRSRRSCLFLPTVTAFVAVLVLWLGWDLRDVMQRSLVQRFLGREPKIAVLPFENLGKPEDKYFADGLTEKITQELESTQWRQVSTRPSTVRYINAGKPLSEFGEDLKADYVLRGTVHLAVHGDFREPVDAGIPQSRLPGRYVPIPDKNTTGTQVRRHVSRVQITSRLIRVVDNASIWTDTFEEDIFDVVQAQEQISRRVVEAMDSTLIPRKSLARLYLNDTRRLEALGLKLRHEGRLIEAVAVFRRASDLEPRSSRLTPKIAETYRALREHEQAERYLAKAFSLGPKVFFWKQIALNQRAWTGDPKKVRALLNQSPVPESPELQAIAFQLDLDERNYTRALARLSPEWLQRLPLQDQSRIAVMTVLARERLGDREGALKTARANRAFLEGHVKSFPREPMNRAYLALALAQLGQRSEALTQAEKAVHDGRNDAFSGPRAIEVQAMVDAVLGRRREAVTRLTRLLSMAYQDSICIPQLRIDPIWDPLRGDPEFEGLLHAPLAPRRPPLTAGPP